MVTLIPQWKSSWRFTSLQAGWVLGFFDAVYAADAWGLQDTLGPQWFGVINAAVVSIVIPWLRNVQQSPPLAPEVKREIVEHIKDSPTATPAGVVEPAKPTAQSARQYIDEQIDRKLLEIEKRIARKKRAPSASRTKELAAEFVKDKP